MKKMLISKQNGIPSLLPVLLIGGPLVLGQDSLQHGAVQGSLDAESPSVKEVLGQPRERLLHFGGLVHGIIVVETELVESSSIEGPSLPSNIVKEGSAWDYCDCPEKEGENINQKNTFFFTKYFPWIEVQLPIKLGRKQNIQDVGDITWVQVCLLQAEAASPP